MELLSNLIWAAVALVLWTLWMMRRRGTRDAGLCPGIQAQLIALAVLTLILLPVISVSDDLQASQNPAEIDRTSVRNDQHVLQPDTVRPFSGALAAVISCFPLSYPRTIAFLRSPALRRGEQIADVRVLDSRPPPAA